MKDEEDERVNNTVTLILLGRTVVKKTLVRRRMVKKTLLRRRMVTKTLLIRKTIRKQYHSYRDSLSKLILAPATHLVKPFRNDFIFCYKSERVFRPVMLRLFHTYT